MQGTLLGLSVLFGLYCLYKQFKLNMDELRAAELEEKNEQLRAENQELAEQLQNKRIKIEVVKTYGY